MWVTIFFLSHKKEMSRRRRLREDNFNKTWIKSETTWFDGKRRGLNKKRILCFLNFLFAVKNRISKNGADNSKEDISGPSS